jgi:hypothetical protein
MKEVKKVNMGRCFAAWCPELPWTSASRRPSQMCHFNLVPPELYGTSAMLDQGQASEYLSALRSVQRPHPSFPALRTLQAPHRPTVKTWWINTWTENVRVNEPLQSPATSLNAAPGLPGTKLQKKKGRWIWVCTFHTRMNIEFLTLLNSRLK